MFKNLSITVIVATLISVAACADLEVDNADQGVALETLESAATNDDSPREITNASFSSCPPGNLCFFTGPNGTGSMCRWTQVDDDWTRAPTTCSWARTQNVCSIFNRWSGTVDYFRGVGFTLHVGSTRRDVAGNLACTYHVLSHH